MSSLYAISANTAQPMPRTAIEKQEEQLRSQYKLCSVITASSSASNPLSFRELTNCGVLIKYVPLRRGNERTEK